MGEESIIPSAWFLSQKSPMLSSTKCDLGFGRNRTNLKGAGGGEGVQAMVIHSPPLGGALPPLEIFLPPLDEVKGGHWSSLEEKSKYYRRQNNSTSLFGRLSNGH